MPLHPRVPLTIVHVTSSPDLVVVRQRTRSLAMRLGLDTTKVTKLGTALSEICRQAMRSGPATLRFELLGADRLAIGVHPPTPWDVVLPLIRDLGTLLFLNGDHHLCIPLPAPLDDAAFKKLDLTVQSSELNQMQVAHQDLVHAHQAEERARHAAERANLELAAANDALARRTRELARSNRDLEVVAAAAAHDLKEPLQVIRMFATIIERTSPAVVGQAKVIRESADRMSQMLAGLMELAQVRGEGQGVAELHAVAGALRADLMALIERTGGTLEILGDARVAMSPAHLRAVLQNLVTNGLKYGRAGTPPTVQVSAESGPRGVRLRVLDNGRGIPADQRTAIFSLFTRLDRDRDDEGTGVGLALVRRILDEYEGQVLVEDAEGPGTCFVLDLPGALSPRPSNNPSSP